MSPARKVDREPVTSPQRSGRWRGYAAGFASCGRRRRGLFRASPARCPGIIGGECGTSRPRCDDGNFVLSFVPGPGLSSGDARAVQKLTPARAENLRASIAFALTSDGRLAKAQSAELIASIVAERLIASSPASNAIASWSCGTRHARR